MRESTREETRRRQRHQALVFVMSSAVDTSHTPLFGAQASIAKTATHHADGGTRFDSFAPAHLPATSPVSPSMSRRPKPLHSERLVNHLAPVALICRPLSRCPSTRTLAPLARVRDVSTALDVTIENITRHVTTRTLDVRCRRRTSRTEKTGRKNKFSSRVEFGF